MVVVMFLRWIRALRFFPNFIPSKKLVSALCRNHLAVAWNSRNIMVYMFNVIKSALNFSSAEKSCGKKSIRL